MDSGTIDHFTDANNAQLEFFNSRYWSPDTEAMDVFACSWEGETNWFCPPIYVIPRVILHAEKTHAHGRWVAILNNYCGGLFVGS